MSKPLRSLRLSPKIDYARFTGSRGEIYYDSVNNTLRIFNSQTVGGEILATRNWVLANSSDFTVDSIRSENDINIDINLADSTVRRWRFGEDGELTFPDSTAQITAYQTTREITHTVDVSAPLSTTGEGSNILIRDNYQTERVLVSNGVFSEGRATLPNVSVYGKIVILVTLSANETFIDRNIWNGSMESFSITNGADDVVILMSLAANGWKVITQSP
jgi:hypothetical protein